MSLRPPTVLYAMIAGMGIPIQQRFEITYRQTMDASRLFDFMDAGGRRGPSWMPTRTNRRSLWKRRRAAGFNRGGYRSKSKRAKKFTT